MNKFLHIRKPFFFFLFLFTCLFTEQKTSAQLFEAGPVIGFNASQIVGDGFRGFRKMGLNAGVAVDVNLDKKYSVGLELLYSQRGSRFIPNALTPTADQEEYFMDYLELPIIFKYHDVAGMDFGGGFSLGRSVRNVYKLNGIDDTTNRFGEPSVDNGIDFGLFGDATYNVNQTFRIGFRWAFSAPVVTVNDNRIGRHSVISLRLLTMFGAKSEKSNL